jgi:hypothetical protein
MNLADLTGLVEKPFAAVPKLVNTPIIARADPRNSLVRRS